MGVLYSILPLAGEVREYLEGEGLKPPTESGRHPTPLEIRGALRRLPTVVADFRERDSKLVEVMLTSGDPDQAEWTLIHVEGYVDESTPVDFWFEKGHPELIVAALCAISSITGPLVLFPDTGGPPLVVSHTVNAPDLLAAWDREGA